MAEETKELIAALNDPDQAKALMAKHGWSEEELLAKAEEISKEIQESLAAVCVV